MDLPLSDSLRRSSEDVLSSLRGFSVPMRDDSHIHDEMHNGITIDRLKFYYCAVL